MLALRCLIATYLSSHPRRLYGLVSECVHPHYACRNLAMPNSHVHNVCAAATLLHPGVSSCCGTESTTLRPGNYLSVNEEGESTC